jgi:hypothetical protein
MVTLEERNFHHCMESKWTKNKPLFGGGWEDVRRGVNSEVFPFIGVSNLALGVLTLFFSLTLKLFIFKFLCFCSSVLLPKCFQSVFLLI